MEDAARTTDTYAFYVDMVENKYFANVDARNLEGILECFNEDAVFTIQSAHSVHQGRDTEIRAMYVELFQNYQPKMVHKDFRHVVDVGNSRCSAQFNVELISTEGGEEIFLTNCNFFYFENGKFKEVYVYMSDGQNVLG
ncbi:nuclear transport factor 2 family protein [Aneurinibacillus sp. REN35]|uniref:nuclear transport factor 2 family protein n=1 Tax=Aneurinibacillus sp. REN35 TaxID=3237286 RepID=UPI003528ED99